jgi:hypothetical protein
MGRVAEGWNLNAIAVRRFDDSFAFHGVKLSVVDFDFDFHHFASCSNIFILFCREFGYVCYCFKILNAVLLL